MPIRRRRRYLLYSCVGLKPNGAEPMEGVLQGTSGGGAGWKCKIQVTPGVASFKGIPGVGSLECFFRLAPQERRDAWGQALNHGWVR